MLDKEKDVQGIAMYAQWKKDGSLMQVLFTPDGYGTGSDPKLIPGAMFRRITTTYQPKRQWRGTMVTSLSNPRWMDEEHPLIKEKTLDPTLPTDDRATQEEIASARTQYIARVLGTIHGQDWTLDGEPLYVETSKKDIDDIAVDKTPSKLMYRINQLREAKGLAMAPIAEEVL